MTTRSGTFGRLAILAALALLLTGCLKLDMDIAIQTDDTVDGTVIFAVNKDVLSLTGGSFEDLVGGQTPFPSELEGMTSEDYDEGEFVGKRYTFEGVSIAEFSDPADPDSLSITHEGDTFVVDGAFDLSQGAGATGATGPFGGTQGMESAELRIAITFPGEVTDANGEIDGTTVVWEPKFGERQEIRATASAIASGGGDSWTLVFVLLGVAAVAIIASAVLMVRRRRRGAPEIAPTEGISEPAAPSEPSTPPVPSAPMDVAHRATPPAEPPPTAPPAEPPPAAPPAEVPPAEVPPPAAPEPPAGSDDDVPPPPNPG